MPDTVEAVASILLSCRRGKRFEGSLPLLSRMEAYCVQARVLADLGDTVAGWKVAVVDGIAEAAPLPARTIADSGQTIALDSGPMKLETELAFRLRHDLAPRAIPYARDEVLTAIESVHVAFEIVAPRIGEPPAVPFAAFLSDNLGNLGTVIGAGRSTTTLPERGELIREGTVLAAGAHPNGDPLANLVAYASSQSDRLGGLRSGQFVITGSFTGAVPVTSAGHFCGLFERFEPVTALFTD